MYGEARGRRGAAAPRGPWWRSFVYAGAGLGLVWRTERNFRVQGAAGWAALSLAWLGGLPATRVAVLLGLVATVLALETMNTALEVLVDLASPEHHPLAATAKDLAAGAVLVASLGALLAGGALFWPLGRGVGRVAAGVAAHPLGTALAALGLVLLVAAAARPLPGRRNA